VTQPLNGNWFQSLVLETVLTFILMFVILGSGLDRRAPIGFAGLAIGLTVGLEASIYGTNYRGSMNQQGRLVQLLSENLAAPLGLLGCTNFRSAMSIGLSATF